MIAAFGGDPAHTPLGPTLHLWMSTGIAKTFSQAPAVTTPRLCPLTGASEATMEQRRKVAESRKGKGREKVRAVQRLVGKTPLDGLVQLPSS